MIGIRTIAGVSAAAALVAVVAVAVPKIPSLFPAQVTASTAAALVGVPAEQVVETRDGAVAFEVVPGPERAMNIYLVTQARDGLTQEHLATIPVPAGLFDDQSSTVWMDWVSCSPLRGIEHPNFIVGGANPPPTHVAVSHASETAAHDMYFLVVLEGSDLADGSVAISLGNGSATTPAAAFDRGDACRGEEIPPH